MRTLYPYQQEGVAYLQAHGRGYLWDDPGLGKTCQAVMAAKDMGKRILVICPNTLKRWWRQEIHECDPGTDVLLATVGGRFKYDAHGNRLEFEMKLPSLAKRHLIPKWTVVHYAGARLQTEEFASVPWDVVIVDEAHYIKNRKAARSKAVKDVTPPDAARIGLTATPFNKNPADWWSQLDWMAPNRQDWQSFWRFRGTFAEFTMEEGDYGRYPKFQGAKNLDLLSRVMAYYGLRRKKTHVAPQLPQLQETYLPLPLEGKQREVYRKLKKAEAEARILGEDGKITKVIMVNVLAKLTRLEQFLSHPWTVDSGIPGAKLQWTKEWTSSYTEPAVIATRFKPTANHIAGLLKTTAISGDISEKKRARIQKEWEAGQHQYLVGTIHTIGTGLNLAKAHKIILYDQVHSAILMDQVKQRIHRLTTDHPVEAIYLHIEKTTNDLVLKAFKQAWQTMDLVRSMIEELSSSRKEV